MSAEETGTRVKEEAGVSGSEEECCWRAAREGFSVRISIFLIIIGVWN
jgi:hypothetical protein